MNLIALKHLLGWNVHRSHLVSFHQKKQIFLIVFLLPLQGGSSRVPQEKERVRQMSGKPCGRAGKPKQDPDRGAEGAEGHLLPQSWVVAAVRSHGLKTAPFTNCYSKNKKEKTLEQKVLWLSLCHLLTQAWFTPNSEASQGSGQLELFQFCSCSYLVLFACEDLNVVHTMLAVAVVHRAKPANDSQLKKRNRKRNYRCFLNMHHSNTEITKKKILGRSARALHQQVSMRSGEVHEKLRRSTSSFNQETPMCLPEHVICVINASVLVISCIPSCKITLSRNLSRHFVSDVISWKSSPLPLCILELITKVFQELPACVFGCLCTLFQHRFEASSEGHYVNHTCLAKTKTLDSSLKWVDCII